MVKDLVVVGLEAKKRGPRGSLRMHNILAELFGRDRDIVAKPVQLLLDEAGDGPQAPLGVRLWRSCVVFFALDHSHHEWIGFCFPLFFLPMAFLKVDYNLGLFFLLPIVCGGIFFKNGWQLG